MTGEELVAKALKHGHAARVALALMHETLLEAEGSVAEEPDRNADPGDVSEREAVQDALEEVHDLMETLDTTSSRLRGEWPDIEEDP